MNSVCVYVRENCTTFTIFSPAFFTLYSTPAAHVCSVMIYFAIETSMSVSPDFLNHWVCSKGGPCFLVLMPKVWFVPPASGCAPMSSSSHEAPGISLGAWTLRNACWLLHQLLWGHPRVIWEVKWGHWAPKWLRKETKCGKTSTMESHYWKSWNLVVNGEH